MGIPNKPARVKLIIGLIYKGINEYFTVKPFLLRAFGPIDFESPELEFNCTDYYEREFGCGLRRRFISFSRLIGADSLAAIKCLTNKMEKKCLAAAGVKLILIPAISICQNLSLLLQRTSVTGYTFVEAYSQKSPLFIKRGLLHHGNGHTLITALRNISIFLTRYGRNMPAKYAAVIPEGV